MSFLIAPIEALVDDRLSDPERRVLLSLYSFRNKNADTVWPSIYSLAERANIKDHTRVSKITTSLADKGWLTKKRRGFTGGNEYRLTVPFTYKGDTKLDSGTNLGNEAKLAYEPKMDQGANTNLDSDTNTNLDSDTKYKEQQSEQQSEQQNTRGESIPKSIPFEEFWDAYPRKTNRTKAETAWRRLKCNPDLFDRIKKHIEARFRSGDWSLDRKEFILHASTFINQRRWEDEIIPRGQNHASSNQPSRPNSAVDRVRAGNDARAAEREKSLQGGGQVINYPGTAVGAHD